MAAIPYYDERRCVGCARQWRQPPFHVVGDRLYCERCTDKLLGVLLAMVEHIQAEAL